MLVQKCKTCKHWIEQSKTIGTKAEGNYAIMRRHEYWTTPVPKSFGVCLCSKFVSMADASFNRAPPPQSDTLVYGDSEGYTDWFMTGPDFGCVHWEEK